MPRKEKTPLKPGQRFDRLVVVSRSEKRSRFGVVYECQCDCGTRTTAIGTQLLSGARKSCGCAKRDAQLAFGDKEKLNRLESIKRFYSRSQTRVIDIVFERDRKEFFEAITPEQNRMESVESTYDDDWRRRAFEQDANGFKER